MSYCNVPEVFRRSIAIGTLFYFINNVENLMSSRGMKYNDAVASCSHFIETAKSIYSFTKEDIDPVVSELFSGYKEPSSLKERIRVTFSKDLI